MTINEALALKEEQRINAINLAESKSRALYQKMPSIKVIDKQLESLPFRIFSGESKESISAEAEKLRAERARILAAIGLSADYDTPVFQCTDCDDSGYVQGLKVCQCVKNMVSASKYAQSTLAKGLSDKSFDNFSLDFYQDGNRQNMEKIFNYCKNFAKECPRHNSAGLVFRGGTGLGKTHLSAAVANLVAGRGYSVLFESAQQIFDTCDGVRFNRMDLSEKEKYEKVTLLIIDDLGAECITPYSVSYLSNLIDNRMVNGKPTVINTNLTLQALKKTYGERMYSRLLGEFKVMEFAGKDIRMQKIKNEKG